MLVLSPLLVKPKYKLGAVGGENRISVISATQDAKIGPLGEIGDASMVRFGLLLARFPSLYHLDLIICQLVPNPLTFDAESFEDMVGY